MRKASWIFRLAGIYGIVVLVPQYFLEGKIGTDDPPPITHPEYFYGFVGLGVVWQLAFLVIGQDPVRYRWMMLPAILEKASFGVPCVVLAMLGRISSTILTFASIDLLLGLAFLYAFVTTPSKHSSISKD